jgi:hypothetical protein
LFLLIARKEETGEVGTVAQSKRIGRPRKVPEPGERVALGLKVTSQVKNKIEAAADATGRTQSQEAELRLEQSFEREGLLPDVLSLAYGPQLGAVLILLGEVMKGAGERAGIDSTGTHEGWLEDPYAFNVSMVVANNLLELLRPPGEIVPPAALAGSDQGVTDRRQRYSQLGLTEQKMRELLGPILLDRIKRAEPAFLDRLKNLKGKK